MICFSQVRFFTWNSLNRFNFYVNSIICYRRKQVKQPEFTYDYLIYYLLLFIISLTTSRFPSTKSLFYNSSLTFDQVNRSTNYQLYMVDFKSVEFFSNFLWGSIVFLKFLLHFYFSNATILFWAKFLYYFSSKLNNFMESISEWEWLFQVT